jgi:hypothetical protein
VGFQVRDSNPQGLFGFSFNNPTGFILRADYHSDFGPVVRQDSFDLDSD